MLSVCWHNSARRPCARRRPQPDPDDEAAPRRRRRLVDLAGIAELKGIRADGGEVVIGAMTTQHELIASELLADKMPILRETSC